MQMPVKRIALFLTLAAIAGCDRAPVKTASVITIATAGSASIHGVVRFKGTPPTPKSIDNSICKHAMPITDESVLVDKDGGLANVIVYLAGVTGPTDASPPPAVTLDQKDCRFVPHAIALRTGQTLHLLNSDDEIHNVHGSPTNGPPFNATLTKQGATQDLKFDAADLFTVRCDVHPWMKCTVGVFDSSYFAVTDAGGGFHIDGLPPGTYDLHAWHERYGELTANLTIAADGSSPDIKLVYEDAP